MVVTTALIWPAFSLSTVSLELITLNASSKCRMVVSMRAKLVRLPPAALAVVSAPVVSAITLLTKLAC